MLNAVQTDRNQPVDVITLTHGEFVASTLQIEFQIICDSGLYFGRSLCTRHRSGKEGGVHLGFLFLFNKAKLCAVLFPGNGSKNTVCDSVGQHVWPLVNGLISDPDFFGGCCHAAAKKFDCFCLFHSCGLNHSSFKGATIVFPANDTMESYEPELL